MTYHQLTLALALLISMASVATAFGPQAKPEAVKNEVVQTETAKPDGADKPTVETDKASDDAMDVDFLSGFFDAVRDSKDPEKNVICSPFGASCIGEMLYWGATGSTRRTLVSVFHPESGANESPKWLRIGKDADKMSYISVNGIWHQKDFAFLPTYIQKIRETFEPEIAEADFNGQAQVECDKMNAWVSKATNERITELFSQLDSKTRLVLVNAICFHGKWATPFAVDKTTTGDFHCIAEKKVEARFMKRTDRFLYGENETCQYLEMPYEQGLCSMFLVLPRSGQSLKAAEASLTVREIDRIRDSMVLDRIDVRLPKFVFETEIDLKAALTAMGAGILFDSTKADFSRMDGSGSLAVDQAVQKVFISVDENGTEAAAATGAVVGLKSLPMSEERSKTFHADRPFFFLIRDNVNEIPLFVGRVVDPS